MIKTISKRRFAVKIITAIGFILCPNRLDHQRAQSAVNVEVFVDSDNARIDKYTSTRVKMLCYVCCSAAWSPVPRLHSVSEENNSRGCQLSLSLSLSLGRKTGGEVVDLWGCSAAVARCCYSNMCNLSNCAVGLQHSAELKSLAQVRIKCLSHFFTHYVYQA